MTTPTSSAVDVEALRAKFAEILGSEVRQFEGGYDASPFRYVPANSLPSICESLLAALPKGGGLDADAKVRARYAELEPDMGRDYAICAITNEFDLTEEQTYSIVDRPALSPSVRGDEPDPVDALIRNLDDLAKIVGARFVPDPEKVARYRAALQGGTEPAGWLATEMRDASEAVEKWPKGLRDSLATPSDRGVEEDRELRSLAGAFWMTPERVAALREVAKYDRSTMEAQQRDIFAKLSDTLILCQCLNECLDQIEGLRAPQRAEGERSTNQTPDAGTGR
jgi:hypothetical protein